MPGRALEVAQAYVDEDPEEVLYTAAWSVDMSSGDPLLVVAGLRGVVKVINCSRAAVVRTLRGHGNAVNELRVVETDPSLLLTVSKDESVRLWNMATCVCVAIFAGDAGHRDEVLCVVRPAPPPPHTPPPRARVLRTVFDDPPPPRRAQKHLI